ncbi:DUF4082 domain-containing protein [Virgisporangium aurantiacum]|uniref:DUF4082 domain-containing protein n=1 Tax=Virgisporangium aurantiacum TaxID=175570 RepID=UPI001952559C|nr:DUF4082 domain-containing protein [Virgisporangium aurantiacum]
MRRHRSEWTPKHARRRPTRWLAGITATGLALLAGVVASQPAVAADDPCSINAITCENSKAGTSPAEWDDLWGAGDDSIQGFTTDVSVNAGGTVSFKISATTAYRVDIYRLGYYQGNGARLITSFTPQTSLALNQPACVTNAVTEIYDCGTWRVSATWAVPANQVSGVYIAKLTRIDNNEASHTPFVVRNDASTSPVFFKTSDATWQAYNDYGGSNFYWGGPQGRALKVSYNRPYATRNVGNGRDWVFSNEYPMIRFLERNGYDISYTTDIDSDRRGNLIKNHKTFLSVGHDEYWSGQQRANVEAARDAGTNLAFFSGNEVYWKTRYENSTDGSNTAYRTLVCYKETWAADTIDPSPEWTGTWRDPRFTPPKNGNRPENALTGTMYMSNNTDLAMQVPAEQGKNRFWRNTTVATLGTGQVATLAPHTVGYESNEDVDNGFRPAGLIRLSTTTGASPEYLQDFGLHVAPGTTTHNMTMYRAASGARVFSAGTIQWAWGLDSEHDGTQSPADPRMQQATLNILADLDSFPTTLMSGMVMPTKTTDVVAPTAVISTPAAGTTIVNGSQVTLTGTATDTGGRVAGIEVSTDGATWHPATSGTSSWSYTFIASGAGTMTVRVRAIDDSANIGTVIASRSYPLSGPGSLFGDRTPKVPAADDGGSVTLGVKFTPQNSGNITGIRFYKGTGNTGTHVGTLWTAGGQQLRTGTFSNETASGWQTLTFSSPVQVLAGNTYVASYFAPVGRYSADDRFFSSLDWKSGPLTAPRGPGNNGNGVYRTGNGFPVETSPTDTNYYVDVNFVDGGTGSAPTVLVNSPEAGQTGVDLAVAPTATFSKSVNPASITFTLKDSANVAVAGAITYDDPTRTVTFTPATALGAGKQYTATVNASDTGGTPLAAPKVWSFTTTPYTTFSTLFATNATPAQASSGDNSGVTLGVKFTPTVNGQLVGIRYYQGPGNTGTHTGTLYNAATQQQLAKVTFPSNDGTGWRSAQFSAPINVTAGTTYIAAYWAPLGNYAVTSNFYATQWTNSDATMTAFNGSNGVFKYGTDTFPTDSYGSTNYWVDPLFIPASIPQPPQPDQPPAGSVFLMDPAATPGSASWDDSSSLEVGVKFASNTAGQIRGVRFWKGAGNTGTHTATLWGPTGLQIATATYVTETASGWQTVLFDTPVTVTVGATYTVSYHTNTGHYALTLNGFASPYSRGPLSVPAGGAVYSYGSTVWPTASSNHNYWVDVVFVPGN